LRLAKRVGLTGQTNQDELLALSKLFKIKSNQTRQLVLYDFIAVSVSGFA
jgi:hypothetical protein